MDKDWQSTRKKRKRRLVKIWDYVVIHRKTVIFSVLGLTVFLNVCHLVHKHFVSPPHYAVRSLGVHGLLLDVKVAINNHGDAVGTILVAPHWPRPPIHNLAFLDQGSKVTLLGTLPGSSDSTAVAINDRDEIVGISDFPNGTSNAFLWRHGTLTNLGVDSQRTYFFNNNGEIVSSFDTAQGIRAIAWENGKQEVLTAYGGDTLAGGINNEGVVAGNATDAEGLTHTVLWINGKMQDFNHFFMPPHVNVSGISDDRQVIGAIGHDAVIWQGNSLQRVGTSGGSSSAKCINRAGQVVGLSGRDWLHSLDYDGSHAFLWQKGELFDLNDFIPARSGWTLQEATGINDQGQIVGNGLFNNQPCSFLLTPLP